MKDEAKTGDWIVWLSVVIAILMGFGSGALAHAQPLAPIELVLAAHYDLDAAAYTYCRTVGRSGVASDEHINGRVLLTAAASTTVTGTNAFANIAVGDILLINDQGVMLQRVVEARASADSITISGAAVTLASAPFRYRKLQCGTADDSGAFSVDDWRQLTIQVILAQENSASTDYQIQCRARGPATAWSVVNGPNNDAGVFNDVFSTDISFGECRVGAQVNTDDGGDTGANAERLTILVKGVK